MEELTYLERIWAWIVAHRIEATFTFVLFINPVLTYLLTHQWKKTAQSFLGRYLKRWEIRSLAFVMSLGMNLAVAIRWGLLHPIDAAMIALPVAGLVPWTVKVIMDVTKDSPRFGWVYNAMSVGKDDKPSDPTTDDDTVFGGEP